MRRYLAIILLMWLQKGNATIYIANNNSGQTIYYAPGDTLRFLHLCIGTNECMVYNGGIILWDSNYLGPSNTPVPGFIADYVLTGNETAWSENEDDLPCGISGTLALSGTGISNANSLQVKIYPNPAGAMVFVGASAMLGTITITDLMGEQVFRNNYDAKQANIDIGVLPAGIYILRVQGRSVRLVKE